MADFSRAIQGVSGSMQDLVTGEQANRTASKALDYKIQQDTRREDRLDEQDRREIEIHKSKMEKVKERQRQRDIARKQEEESKKKPFNLAQSQMVQGASPDNLQWIAQKTQSLVSIFDKGKGTGKTDEMAIGDASGTEAGVGGGDDSTGFRYGGIGIGELVGKEGPEYGGGKGSFYDYKSGNIMVRQEDGSWRPISEWEFQQEAPKVAMTLGIATDGMKILEDLAGRGVPGAAERLKKAKEDPAAYYGKMYETKQKLLAELAKSTGGKFTKEYIDIIQEGFEDTKKKRDDAIALQRTETLDQKTRLRVLQDKAVDRKFQWLENQQKDLSSQKSKLEAVMIPIQTQLSKNQFEVNTAMGKIIASPEDQNADGKSTPGAILAKVQRDILRQNLIKYQAKYDEINKGIIAVNNDFNMLNQSSIPGATQVQAIPTRPPGGVETPASPIQSLAGKFKRALEVGKRPEDFPNLVSEYKSLINTQAKSDEFVKVLEGMRITGPELSKSPTGGPPEKKGYTETKGVRNGENFILRTYPDGKEEIIDKSGNVIKPGEKSKTVIGESAIGKKVAAIREQIAKEGNVNNQGKKQALAGVDAAQKGQMKTVGDLLKEIPNSMGTKRGNELVSAMSKKYSSNQIVDEKFINDLKSAAREVGIAANFINDWLLGMWGSLGKLGEKMIEAPLKINVPGTKKAIQ